MLFDTEYVLFTKEEARQIFEEIEYEINNNRTLIIVKEVFCNANFKVTNSGCKIKRQL